MSRIVTVAAAQLGPIQKADSRASVVARMIALMDEAKTKGADFIVYPELALTTFFPRWHVQERAEFDHWFEAAMPNPEVQPLFDRAKALGMAMTFGYAELTPEGRHFNTSILVDREGRTVGLYRKVHLPGHVEFDPERTHQHLEKRYFEPGDLGFPVWRTMGGLFGMCICNDRRWPEVYRVMGLQGVEMVTLGFNTPVGQQPEGGGRTGTAALPSPAVAASRRLPEFLLGVAVAKAGTEDGHHLMGGTMIVNPDGHVVAELPGEEDGVLVHPCDLDATRFGKETIFDFKRHRRPEHYGRITSQVGVVEPPASS